jgi:GAF domain-containing protein
LEELTAVLAQMGAVVLSAETIDSTIELVTTLAAETIPATTGAGVTLVDAHGKRSMAASDPLVERADALQYQFDSGPCLTAWRDQVTVRVDDTDGETRWPQWTAAVAELDLRAMLSVPLVTSGAAIGAIKVYSGQPAAYNARAERLLELFARQAAILLSNTQALADARRLSAQLIEALNNRDVIAQAQGVLIAPGRRQRSGCVCDAGHGLPTLQHQTDRSRPPGDRLSDQPESRPLGDLTPRPTAP